MLKISTFETKTQRQVIVEGRLVPPLVSELLFIVQQQRDLADAEGRELIVDMRDLRSISQEGENVLLQLLREGIRFSVSGAFTRLVLKHVSRRMAVATS